MRARKIPCRDIELQLQQYNPLLNLRITQPHESAVRNIYVSSVFVVHRDSLLELTVLLTDTTGKFEFKDSMQT